MLLPCPTKSRRGNASLVPHILEVISESQGLDWVEWPEGNSASRYRAYRQIQEGLADVLSLRLLANLLFPGQRWGTIVLNESSQTVTWGESERKAKS
jgi:hypothetical protein